MFPLYICKHITYNSSANASTFLAESFDKDPLKESVECESHADSDVARINKVRQRLNIGERKQIIYFEDVNRVLATILLPL